MADLDIVIFGMCSTDIYWEKEVKDYLVTFERVDEEKRGVLYDYTCSCNHYKFRCAHRQNAYCKHIRGVRSERCGWDQQIDGGEVEHDGVNYICPRCGADAELYKAGV
jgi:predicted nucleic acid-binding Zn finger protein